MNVHNYLLRFHPMAAFFVTSWMVLTTETMKRIAYILTALLMLGACQSKPAAEPAYIVQVSLGGWYSPDYTAEEIVSRIDTVSSLIPVRKVIIGWNTDANKLDGYLPPGSHVEAEDITYHAIFAKAE